MKTVSLNTQHSFTRSPTSSSVVTMFSVIKPTSTLTTYATQVSYRSCCAFQEWLEIYPQNLSGNLFIRVKTRHVIKCSTPHLEQMVKYLCTTSKLNSYIIFLKELSKPSLGNLSKQVEKIAETWKKGTPFSNNDGLSQPKQVDLISKKIAENWNEKGQSYAFYKNDLGMSMGLSYVIYFPG